jgi:ParB family transcriptional regulator, chromosome partitioning protein
LLDQFGYAQADLAKVVGKSRSHVANTMRLSKLPEPVKALVMAGELSAGHARALLAVRDPEGVARKVVAQGLTVRDVERLAQNEAVVSGEERAPSKTRARKDADTRALELELSEVCGLAVRISHDSSGSGVVSFRYRSLEQLDALRSLLLR